MPAVPRIYQLSYAVGLCGPTLKAWSPEKFGDAIMSAAALKTSAERGKTPPDHRVDVEMSGKMNAAQYLVSVRGRGTVCAR